MPPSHCLLFGSFDYLAEILEVRTSSHVLDTTTDSHVSSLIQISKLSMRAPVATPE